MRRSRNTSRDKERQTGVFGRLFSLLLFIVTVISGAALILTLVAPYFASTHSWVFPFFGLISPAVYIFNLMLLLYFVIQWRLRFALPLLMLMLMGVNRVPLYVKIPLTKDYGLDSYKGCVKLMSFNIRGEVDNNRRSSTDRIAEYILSEKPDIVCLQEYDGTVSGSNGTLKSQLSKYNLATNEINAIFTRYPIIAHGDLFDRADTLGGRSIYADLRIGKDTVRVINNHLNSNLLEPNDKAYLKPKTVIRDTMRNEKLGSIVRKFARGAAERTAQVKVIRASMDSSPYRYIVCGDMNDVPISFAYYELSRGMQDAFVECGDGYSYTYRGFGNMLRIDYILTSEGLTPRSYTADSSQTVSDHVPIISHIKIDKR